MDMTGPGLSLGRDMDAVGGSLRVQRFHLSKRTYIMHTKKGGRASTAAEDDCLTNRQHLAMENRGKREPSRRGREKQHPNSIELGPKNVSSKYQKKVGKERRREKVGSTSYE